MKITIAALLMTILCLTQTAAVAAEPQKEADLDQIADETKFQNAFGFYKLREYDRALQELGEYLEIYTTGRYRKEAFKYAAQIYFDRFKYLKSIRTYRALFEEFPNAEEGIEAYFNIGLCYRVMGDDRRAREVFEGIVSDYPSSPYANKARILIDLIEVVKK